MNDHVFLVDETSKANMTLITHIEMLYDTYGDRTYDDARQEPVGAVARALNAPNWPNERVRTTRSSPPRCCTTSGISSTPRQRRAVRTMCTNRAQWPSWRLASARS